MASYNDRPRQADDLFRILGRQPPHEVEDRASLQQCSLESYAATPSYEP
jgi:branched-chain amino acid transport system substrate-binding protein